MLKVTELLTSTGWIQTVWLQSLWAVTCSTRAMPRDLKVISKREELHKLLFFLHSYLHTSSFHNSTSTPRRKPTHKIATSCSHHPIGRFSLSSLPCFLTLLYFKSYKKQLSLFKKKTHISKSKQSQQKNKQKLTQKKQVIIFKSHLWQKNTNAHIHK